MVAIPLVASGLTSAAYGSFSISLATATFVGSLIFGPILQAIVPLHAQYVAQEQQEELESGIFSLILMLAFAVIVIGTLVVLAGWIGWAELALMSSFSLFSTWQPVLRARLQFWRYGLAALFQGALLISLLLVWQQNGKDLGVLALWAYTCSYMAGFLVAWLLAGATRPKPLSLHMVRNILGMGGLLTISAFAESVLFLGFRYVLLCFGSASFLGQFSFALDLAQRSVGVIINIASFAIVPKAYKLDAQGATKAFRALLQRAAVLAGGAAVLMLVLLLFLRYFEFLPGIELKRLSLSAFASVSVAIVINRLKKMALDPIFVTKKMPLVIPACYLIIGLPTLFLASGVSMLDNEQWVLVLYPLAYGMVMLLSVLLLRRKQVPR